MVLRGEPRQIQKMLSGEASKMSKSQSDTKELRIPSEIWYMILQYVTEDFYFAGASEKVYALTHNQCGMGVLSFSDGLASVFWREWWPLRIEDIEKQLQQYQGLMKRRYDPNRIIDRAVVPLRRLYFETLAVWPTEVAGTTVAESQAYVWAAEWMLEKLRSMCPIDDTMQQLSRLDGVWPEICREGDRLACQLAIMQEDISMIKTKNIGSDWARGLLRIQDRPALSVENPARQNPARW